MSTETDKPTAGEQDAGKQKDDAPRADESYTKHRIKRALEKAAPELEAKGRKAIIAELGLDPEDEGALDALKSVVAKGASADSEKTKLEKQLAKLAQERDEHAAQAAELRRAIDTRAVRDAIAEAIGDAPVLPGKLSQVQALLAESFVVLDGKVAVRGEDGEPANIAPKKLVGEWLANNTHFLAATAPKGGAGSRSAGGEPRNGSSKKPRTDAELRSFFEEKLREGPTRS